MIGKKYLASHSELSVFRGIAHSTGFGWVISKFGLAICDTLECQSFKSEPQDQAYLHSPERDLAEEFIISELEIL